MNDALDNYIDGVKRLPAAPVVMIKLIALFRKPDRDVDEVVQLLSHDPSLTAEILRRCNGVFFGGDAVGLDIFDAIMRLGFYEVYQVAMAMGLQTISVGQANSAIKVEKIWRHSAAVAAISGLLARQAGESEGIAYTAGLLHDIGKIVLASAEGSKYAKLVQDSAGFGAAFEDAEYTAFGFGHGAVGARLLTRWGTPSDIAAPVFGHHQSTWSDPFQRLSAIVTLGNLMAHTLEEKAEWDTTKAEPAMAILRIGNEHLDALAAPAREELAKLDGFFSAAA